MTEKTIVAKAIAKIITKGLCVSTPYLNVQHTVGFGYTVATTFEEVSSISGEPWDDTMLSYADPLLAAKKFVIMQEKIDAKVNAR